MLGAARRVALLAAICIAATMIPASATGRPAGAAQSSRQRALDLFDESERLYEKGEFEKAAELLEKAYALHAEPILLYNLARAREGHGDFQGAADAYRAYLQKKPKARDRPVVEQRIRTLEQRVEERRQLEQEQREAKQRLAEMERDAAERQAEQPADTGEESVMAGPLPWVLVGVGVAGIGVGVALGAVAQGKNEDAVAEPIQTEAQQLRDSAEDLALGANIALIGGGVIALTGGVLAVIGLVSGSSESEEVATAATLRWRAGPASLWLCGTF